MQKERDTLFNQIVSNQTMSNLELNLTQFSPLMQSPLQHFDLGAKQENINNSKGVWANEISLLGYICLRGDCNNAAFIEAISSVFGVELPSLPCSLIGTSWGSIYWLAPDEWLIVCERSKRIDIQQKLEAALAGIHSQVLDNSGGFTSVLLQGNNADDALQHYTTYDLHALQSGKIVGTTFGKLSVFLLRHNDGYKLIFRRSFADYIWHYLERAATPYGFGVSKP